jgi:hypothetical protein
VGRNVHPFFVRSVTVDGTSLPGYPGKVLNMPGAASTYPGKLMVLLLRTWFPKKYIAALL